MTVFYSAVIKSFLSYPEKRIFFLSSHLFKIIITTESLNGECINSFPTYVFLFHRALTMYFSENISFLKTYLCKSALK